MADLRYRLYFLNRKRDLKPEGEYRLGRGTGNDVKLPGQTVSRNHARLFWEEGYANYSRGRRERNIARGND